MKKLLVLMPLLLLGCLAGAQNHRLVVRGFTKADIGDMRARTSPAFDRNKKLAALIDITFAASDSTLAFEGMVGEPTHFPGEWLIHVPENLTRLKVYMEDCKPLEFAIPSGISIESGMVYLMDLDIEETIKMRTLIMPSVSVGMAQPMHLSYGVMVGLCKVNGGYFRVKSDFNFGLKTVAECDAEGMIEGAKGWFTGESRKSRFAVTGGYMRHLTDMSDNSSLYAYVGAGYGSRTIAWQMYGADGEYQYAKVVPSSLKGVEAETGVVLRFGGVALSAGIQTNSFKLFEANLGVGIMF